MRIDYRTPNGGVLKRIKNGKIESKGHVIYSERFGLFVVSNPHYRVEVNDLGLALEILWTWRTNDLSSHHNLCECDGCDLLKRRRFENKSEEEEYQWSHP